MSYTYSLVCHETKQKICIGQGHGCFEVLYSGEAEIMDRLQRFLQDHEGKDLQFLCDNTYPGNGEAEDYAEYGQQFCPVTGGYDCECDDGGERCREEEREAERQASRMTKQYFFEKYMASLKVDSDA